MKSMTGFGKGTASRNNKELTIELKSVNGRFIDINSRLPKQFASLDIRLRKKITERIKRGSVDVYFNYIDKSDSSRPLYIDMPLAKSYIQAAKKLRTEFLLEDDFQLAALMRTPEVLRQDIDNTLDEEKAELLDIALNEALEQLDKMKCAEGKHLELDLVDTMLEIAKCVKLLEDRVELIAIEYKQRIETRIKQILENVQLDENRLCQEVAYFADKNDINEELKRMRSHMSQFNQCLMSDGEQGRKLDFIAQEMIREVNTIGSKSSDITNTNTVISIKNNLEKLKEQIRNVE